MVNNFKFLKKLGVPNFGLKNRVIERRVIERSDCIIYFYERLNLFLRFSNLAFVHTHNRNR